MKGPDRCKVSPAKVIIAMHHPGGGEFIACSGRAEPEQDGGAEVEVRVVVADDHLACQALVDAEEVDARPRAPLPPRGVAPTSSLQNRLLPRRARALSHETRAPATRVPRWQDD